MHTYIRKSDNFVNLQIERVTIHKIADFTKKNFQT